MCFIFIIPQHFPLLFKLIHCIYQHLIVGMLNNKFTFSGGLPVLILFSYLKKTFLLYVSEIIARISNPTYIRILDQTYGEVDEKRLV